MWGEFNMLALFSKALFRYRLILLGAVVFISVGFLWWFFWGGVPGGGVLRVDMGGMRVAIPICYANFLEYDGEASPWGKGANARNISPRNIRSIGFYAAIDSSNSLVCLGGRASSGDAGNAGGRVIFVGITTGEFYPGSGWLDRSAQFSMRARVNPSAKYQVVTDKDLDLIEYRLILDRGMSASEVLATGESDFFVHRSASGDVDSFIKCSTRKVSSPPCMHSFSLEPRSKATVEVRYSRGNLQGWKSIEQAIKEKILGFDEAHH